MSAYDLWFSSRHGAEELEKLNEAHSDRPVFHGTGYRLGETEDASETIAGPSVRRNVPQVNIYFFLLKVEFLFEHLKWRKTAKANKRK